jgi:hypothetical protein
MPPASGRRIRALYAPPTARRRRAAPAVRATQAMRDMLTSVRRVPWAHTRLILANVLRTMSVWTDWATMVWNGSHNMAKVVLARTIRNHIYVEILIPFSTAVYVKEN